LLARRSAYIVARTMTSGDAAFGGVCTPAFPVDYVCVCFKNCVPVSSVSVCACGPRKSFAPCAMCCACLLALCKRCHLQQLCVRYTFDPRRQWNPRVSCALQLPFYTNQKMRTHSRTHV